MPQRFIVRREGKSGVLAVKNGKAEWRPVKTGLRGQNMIEISDGLTAGDTVIGALPGKELPRDGRSVRF